MKKLLLIVPSLHQGGSEKVCAMTAVILKPYFDVQIAVFDSRNIDFDVEDVPISDLGLPSGRENWRRFSMFFGGDTGLRG